MNRITVFAFLILSNLTSGILTVNAMKMQLKSADELRKISSSNKKLPTNNKVVIRKESGSYYIFIQLIIYIYICVKRAAKNSPDFEIWPNGLVYYQIDDSFTG